MRSSSLRRTRTAVVTVSCVAVAAVGLHAARPSPARAQATGEALTWAEARAAAERRAPERALAARRAALAETDVAIARALPNPTFTVTTSRLTARLATGVSLPMPLFGQRHLATVVARADVDTALRESALGQSELRWNATMAWIDAWEAAARARLVALAAADADRLLEIARARFEAGSAPRLDVVRATADRARSHAEAEGAGPLVTAAAAHLAVWVGADPIAPPRVVGEPGVPAALPDLAVLVEALALSHPALERDRAEERAATARADLERRLRLPVVSADVMVSQWDPTTPGTDVLAGASFELPILDQRAGSIAHAERQRDVFAAARALDDAHLRADLVDAYHRTRSGAGRAREIGRSALPASEEARALTEESYRAGRADLLRVLDAQRAVLELRLAEREAIGAWARAFADLERAVGAALPQGASDSPPSPSPSSSSSSPPPPPPPWPPGPSPLMQTAHAVR